MGLDRERIEVGEFESVLKGEAARLLALQEQTMTYGRKVRRGKEKGCGKLQKGMERGERGSSRKKGKEW